MGTAGNVKLGPGLLYFGTVGAAEPTDLTTPWATVDPSWKAVGYTDTGSTFSYDVSSDKVEVAEELEPIYNELTGRDPQLSFAMAEITALNLERALNGGTITAIGTLIGTATMVASTDVVTTSVSHSLAVNDKVIFGAMTGGAPLVAGTTYYVKTVPSGTTLTLSATLGGAVLDITTDGSSASISKSAGVVKFEPPALGAEIRIAIGWQSQDNAERWVFRKCFNTGNSEMKRAKAPDKTTIPVEFHLEKVTNQQPFMALFDSAFSG